MLQDLEDAAFFRVPSNGAERDFDPVMMIGLNDHYPLGKTINYGFLLRCFIF